MALNATSLASAVWAQHLALFPTAAQSIRENSLTGVPSHNVPFAFISALCEGFVQAALAQKIYDIGSGTANPIGLAVPIPVLFPSIPLAISSFLVSAGWLGPYSLPVATSLIGNILTQTQLLGQLVMEPNNVLGTGIGVVSPVSNPGLTATFKAALLPGLEVAFTNSGKFGEGDIPTAPLNKQLLKQLPLYADALSLGFGSLIAQVPYVGPVGPTTPLTGIINFGGLK